MRQTSFNQNTSVRLSQQADVIKPRHGRESVLTPRGFPTPTAAHQRSGAAGGRDQRRGDISAGCCTSRRPCMGLVQACTTPELGEITEPAACLFGRFYQRLELTAVHLLGWRVMARRLSSQPCLFTMLNPGSSDSSLNSCSLTKW
ncbi:hypothetical protein RRG08_038327 [Elysia crispata]|uniref:Uncharacterized protein n=1 Tax=Elysia crispata TaxID=231223 RepID=A0AAE1AN06_9GAST|nr:hypothetical protein RRG08_038327 [Elysia crispata]